MESPPSPFLEKGRDRGGFSYIFMPGLGLLVDSRLKSPIYLLLLFQFQPLAIYYLIFLKSNKVNI